MKKRWITKTKNRRYVVFDLPPSLTISCQTETPMTQISSVVGGSFTSTEEGRRCVIWGPLMRVTRTKSNVQIRTRLVTPASIPLLQTLDRGWCHSTPHLHLMILTVGRVSVNLNFFSSRGILSLRIMVFFFYHLFVFVIYK